MTLQQLRYLLAIADSGLNITAASERLYTSQPGISKQLKLLEQELKVQLEKGDDPGLALNSRLQILLEQRAEAESKLAETRNAHAA
ncbi:MAG: LysR family transcriptional regulator, partial [Gammaproteobacteria bacterium]|nr:LysR family transcriptional regulator [Gammaproteobacteria bacterium]